ncbi:unnamed protein product [Hermetia illucens]|uniref:TIR domain-containing protein n=1 Tax=Hermetia illucens TaxID=343691 RepID=A0A7R8YZX2_HERIL|nr:unnamed protein product [Hermetia illucens]
MISVKTVLLVLFYAITAKTSPAQAHFKCENRFGHCECTKGQDHGFWIKCSVIHRYFTIRVQHETIAITCYRSQEFDYSMFPVMNITDTPNVNIFGCPLPENQKLAIFLKRFIIGQVRTMTYWGYSKLDSQTPELLENNFFSGFEKLTKLDLYQNRLHLTKDIFIGLGKLRSLRIGISDLRYLEPGIFRNQKQMEHLAVWRNKLQNLTKSTFTGASSVTYLDLSANELTTLDYDVFQLLPNLEIIYLSTNNFSTLPEKLFFHNQKLQSIHLNGNVRLMESLPPDFLAYHSRMVSVSISASIVSVPGSMFVGSENIESISFADNQLESLPSEIFASQTHLMDLGLSRNRITKLPDDVFNSTVSLRSLCLSYNKLENITRHIFRNLHNLHQLDLSHNKLHSIDLHAFRGTPKLRIIKASNNQLSLFSSGFEEDEKSPFEVLSELQELDLRNNRIIHIPGDWIHSLSNLRNLDISYNPVTCNCTLFPFVQYLNRSNHDEFGKHPQTSATKSYCSESGELNSWSLTSLNYKQLVCQHKPCPSKCICWVHYDQTVFVYCSSSNLTRVPPLHDVPKLKTKSIVLHIANNNITTLPDNHFPGYSLVSELYASNNSISHFTEPNIPINLQVLDLSNNILTGINTSVLERIKQTNQTSHLYLGHNPWECNCNTLGLLSFIRANLERIHDLNFIECTTGAKFLALFPKDLCKESVVYEVLAYIAAAFGVAFALLVGFIHRFRTEIKVWLFAHNMCLYFVTEQNIDEDKKYDAFISYSHKDEDFVIENILPNLENGPIPYSLCLHERDWVPGEFIHIQIMQSVNDSRRTVIVLSPNFLESVWGTLEFQIAYKAALEEARTRIIIIMYSDIGNSVDVGPELKSYLNTNTYIKWSDPWFWEKLRHAMPHPPYRKITNKISMRKEFQDTKAKKSPAEARFKCENRFDKCECKKDQDYEFEIRCPVYQSYFSIEVQHENIAITCYRSQEFDYSMFPVMNITDTPNVNIYGCPLPKNQTLAIFLKRFIIGPVRTMTYWGYSKLNALTPEFLDGLHDFSRTPDNFLGGLMELTKVDFYQNRLYLTKDIFVGLDHLRSLEIGFSDLRYLEPGIFRNQKRMEHLTLWTNKLQNLTKDTFFGASSVTYLDLSGNEFTTLEYDVFRLLPNLEIINLNNNNFSTLPEKLFLNNRKLQSIQLSGNGREMGSLPPDFLAYHSRMVNISISASIVSVPRSIFAGSENIESISFANNQLESLPSEIFASQTHLMDLDLSRNRITKLHDDVFNSTVSLILLSLSHNKLENITRHIFRNLHSLHQLDLSDNRLHSIDLHAFRGTPELRSINASRNHLSFLSKGFGEDVKSPFQVLSKLQELDLRNNRITHISRDWIHSLSNLRNLDISYNPVTCTCTLLPFVQYMNRSNHDEFGKQPQTSTTKSNCSESGELNGWSITSLNYKELVCQHKPCPKMCICWVRYDQTFIVYCSSSNLTKVPSLQDVPKLKTKSIVLHIANNNITTLPDNHFPGYSLVSELYASNNSISQFTGPNIPTNLQVLDLSNNILTGINTSVLERIKQTNQTSHLYLGHNPWQCDCSALSLLSFIRANLERIHDLNFIECTTGAKFLALFPKDLCKESIVYEILAYIAAALGVVFAILVGLMYRFRTEIKVWLFAHNMCLYFVTKQNTDEDKKYDAFISYSHKDEDFVIENLLPNLENGSKPYKLCLHERDWVPGEFIPTQIIQSVNDSRRTVIVLSLNFLESVWGILEFQIAYKAALEEARTRIIIIMYSDIGDSVDVGPELKSYLNTNTYIKWGDPWFWEKLRHAMPHPPYRKITKKVSMRKQSKGTEGINLQLTEPLDELPPPPAAIPLDEIHL